MISVIAKLHVQEGKRDEALDAVKELMAEVAKEEGTLFYSVNVNEKDPNTLVMIERYSDREALDAHGSTPHFKNFMEKAGKFLAGRPEITAYDELESV
ncbi:MAG: putative quinol monooxygenase [Desulfobacterales bacterium]